MNTHKRPSGRRPLSREKKNNKTSHGEHGEHGKYTFVFLRVPRALRASVRCSSPILLFSLFTFLSLASCGTKPSPLYGTWADNKGNTLSFFDDNTFNAQITGVTNLSAVNYSGNYSLLLNSLTLDCTEIEMRIVTEWDIRGNILYLNWVSSEGDAIPLTLFKVSN